jgi:hypothetical protein
LELKSTSSWKPLEFIKDSGTWGLSSEIAALVLFAIAFWEHGRGNSISPFILLVLSVPLFWIGAFVAWNKKAAKLHSIEETKPKIRFSDPTAIYVEHVSQEYNLVRIDNVPFLKIRFVNKPDGPYPSAKGIDVRATIEFYRASDDKHLLSMNGRWADSDQPSALNPLASKASLLATSFGIGEAHYLDIAYLDGQNGKCYAWNNENYNYPFFRCDTHELPNDQIRAEIRLLGEWVDEKFSIEFKVSGNDFEIMPLTKRAKPLSY